MFQAERLNDWHMVVYRIIVVPLIAETVDEDHVV
jgi:hypothetical protein